MWLIVVISLEAHQRAHDAQAAASTHPFNRGTSQKQIKLLNTGTERKQG